MNFTTGASQTRWREGPQIYGPRGGILRRLRPDLCRGSLRGPIFLAGRVTPPHPVRLRLVIPLSAAWLVGRVPYRMTRDTPLFLLLAGLLALLSTAPLAAQSPLDVGFHFSPQLRYLSSEALGEAPSNGSYTRGLSGLSLGAGGGLYLEYEVTPHLFVRGGVDLSYKRNRYRTERVYPELDSVERGRNQVIYTSIEVPVALIYRFDYLRNGNSFLVGVATTVTRNTGAPRAWTTFGDRGAISEQIDYPARTVTVIGGYEHNLSSSVVLGLEPYLSYVPTRFRLETATTTRVAFEGGLSLRLRLDN